MEKTCKTCINLCNKRGEVEQCKNHRSEVQEMLKEIDKKLEEGYQKEEVIKQEEKLKEWGKRIEKLKLEGYFDFEGMR